GRACAPARLGFLRFCLPRRPPPPPPPPRPEGPPPPPPRNKPRRQGLPLDRLEPGLQRELLAPARALRRLEAEEEPELRHRDADLREVEDPVAERLPQGPVPVDRPAPPDERRRGVGLADDARHVGDLPPPRAWRSAPIRRRVHEQPRLRAALPQRLQK